MQLSKIGAILRENDDGSFEQGPISGIGGPFETATEFFKAWAANVTFRLPEAEIRKKGGNLAEDLSSSASSFKHLVDTYARGLSVRDEGLFPLCHGDFGHNNIVFDDNYK